MTPNSSASSITEFPADYPVRLTSIEIDPVYKSLLEPRPEGWLGSDVGYSIPLSPEKSIWLFGDTFVGRMENGIRVNGAAFINNSIGIHDRTGDGPGTVEYFWSESNGKPASFFQHQPGTPGDYYWPTMGTLINGELFVYCYSVCGGFDHTSIPGDTLIRVRNPQDHPSKWHQEAFDIAIPGGRRSFHAALYQKDGYLYMMGPSRGADPMVGIMALARVRIEDLLANRIGPAYEFWVHGAEGPQWSKSPENPVALFSPGVTETCIQFEPTWGLYICTSYRGSGEIYLTVAPDLTGPWSEPVCIYRVPEHRVSFRIISYAVRCHPELSTKPGELVITYETNAPGDIKPLFTPEGAAIYYPRFLRAQLELASGSRGAR